MIMKVEVDANNRAKQEARSMKEVKPESTRLSTF
jgi:hypothetical protein